MLHYRIWIHDAHTCKDLTLLTGHTDAATAVTYSPDGKRIASGNYDKTLNKVIREHISKRTKAESRH